MFDMRMFLITCKGEAMHNPVFQDSIDHIVDQGEKLSGGSIDWIFLLKAESDRLNAKLQKLNAQIQTAKRGKDDERYQELLPKHKDTMEATLNMVQLLQNATKGIQPLNN